MLNNSLKKVLRCGKCPGCQCEPCGTCIYCQDRPKFGGPNVRKKACIKRKCLRVLKKRFQRELPTFNARVGCNNCRDCKMLDCQKCLVCLDKQFFDNHYIPGALCSRKLCNNASRLEIPSTSQFKDLSESRKEIKQECRLIAIEIDDLPGNLMPKLYKVEDQFEENPIETEEYEEEDPVETRHHYLSKKPVEEGTENEKPPYSYLALITMAIKDSPERRLHLSEIYKYIEERFPYYRHLNKKETWQNSIRHKLSVNDCFLMLGSNDKKGNYWTINAGYDDMFTNGNYK
uniref:Forkhead box protein fkh-2 n=1 Tax=Acrobeloides nanus TaxID=290746 RepID=A0A914CSY6_9BILA